MRIGINAAFLDESFNGLSVYTRSVIEEFSNSGHEVYLYTSESALISGNNQIKWRKTPHSLRAEKGSIGNALRVLLWSQTVLPLNLLRDRIDVLLSPIPEGMLVPVCPQVLVVHDLFPFFFPELFPRWRYYFRSVLPKILKASCHIISVSHHTKRDLVSQLDVPEDKIQVVYNSIDPLYFSNEPGVPPEAFENKPYFLFVGRSTAYKNLEMVLRAMAALHNDIEHDLVCVLGFTSVLDKEHFSMIMDLASSLGIRHRVRVYTDIPRTQILYLYRHATALLLLSKYEGFGYPPLEAMAVGTPAIVSDSTSLPEVVGSGGICVPNDEPHFTAKAMKQLACNPLFRAEMSQRGKERAQQFSTTKSSSLIRSLIESCAGPGAK